MLDGIKRLLGGNAASVAAAEEWGPVIPWAEQRGWLCRSVPGEGFVIDGKFDAAVWRLEWGPSQRGYIPGQEMRLRIEAGLPSDLQVVVMNRSLQEQMERTVFEQYVEGVQTRIDTQTPPEMRWLVMFPKLGGTDMGPLRERYVALGSHKGWMKQWLAGALAASLTGHRIDPETPLVLMTSRGRLMLRTALLDPQVGAVSAVLRLFETAWRESQRMVAGNADSLNLSQPASTWAEDGTGGSVAGTPSKS
jgi:hypothetical protein